MAHHALFPQLLGAAYGRLDAPLRTVHRGAAAQYTGTATVERGHGLLARLACMVAGLPRSGRDAPLRFQLEIDGDSEVWTRFFSGSAPMRSRLAGQGAYLVERLGPATVRFALSEREGVLHWRAVSLRVLGIPMPRRAFDFQARVRGRGTRYRFEVDARLALIGKLIRYQGVFDVIA